MKRGKRLLAALLGALLIGLLPLGALAEEAPAVIVDIEGGETAEALMAEDADEVWEPVGTVPADTAALDVGGKSAVLMEQSSGDILFEKNPHEKMPIASVTKVMTLLLVMEALDEGLITLDEPVTCSPTAASMGGSQIWLEVGEVMTVDELVKAAAVVSANDACAALAEHLSGSIEEFVARMNQRAAELGMNDTLFLDCSGLNDEAYSCAYDVAVMSRELMKHPKITDYTTIWMDSLRGGTSQLVNTNKLVRHYAGATGLKTGTTSKAGHNLSATAERGTVLAENLPTTTAGTGRARVCRGHPGVRDDGRTVWRRPEDARLRVCQLQRIHASGGYRRASVGAGAARGVREYDSRRR